MNKAKPDSTVARLNLIQDEHLTDVGRFSFTFDPTYAVLKIAETIYELLKEDIIQERNYYVNKELLKLLDVRLDVIENLCWRAVYDNYTGEMFEPPNSPGIDETELADLEAKAKFIAPIVAVALVSIYEDDFHWLNLALKKLAEAAALKALRSTKLLPWSEKKAIKGFLNDLQIKAKELLNSPIDERGGSKPDYDLADLGKHFESVYPLWLEAKRIYRESQKAKEKARREKWQDAIKSIYPQLPEDLIERLRKFPNLSEEESIQLEKKGGTSAPYDIATEHAARLCGIPSYYYSIRHLKGILSKQGVSARKVKF